jgi:hypothetical protein
MLKDVNRLCTKPLRLSRHRCKKGHFAFNGGKIGPDVGAPLLRGVALTTEYLRQFAMCFSDHRNQRFIEHIVEESVSQKVIGLCLGYENVNDRDTLRYDPLFATLCGKENPSGQDGSHERDKGKACAGKSTLNSLETGEGFWHITVTKKIVLDLDVTENELHEMQRGGSSTDIATATTICRCMCTANIICCVRSSAPSMSILPTG